MNDSSFSPLSSRRWLRSSFAPNWMNWRMCKLLNWDHNLSLPMLFLSFRGPPRSKKLGQRQKSPPMSMRSDLGGKKKVVIDASDIRHNPMNESNWNDQQTKKRRQQKQFVIDWSTSESRDRVDTVFCLEKVLLWRIGEKKKIWWFGSIQVGFLSTVDKIR
jgi:hypothetical protein